MSFDYSSTSILTMDCRKCIFLCYLLKFLVLHINILYAQQRNLNDKVNAIKAGHRSSEEFISKANWRQYKINPKQELRNSNNENLKSTENSQESIPPFLYLSECQREAKECEDIPPPEENEKISEVIEDGAEYSGMSDFSKPVTYEFEPSLQLPYCPEILDKSRILIVSTLDGKVSGLSYKTGEILWSQSTGSEPTSLLSSSMSKMEVTSRGKWVKLIPSLDGGIFRFDGENVEALPVTADKLLYSSFKFNEETIFTGGRSSEIIGIAPDSGIVIYSCNGNGCDHQQATSQSPTTLVIKRISQSVRAIDPRNGNERWNFSVGLHEVNIVGGGCESSLSSDKYDENTILNFILPEGVVRGMSSDHTFEWQQKLESPIVDAWELTEGKLNKLDLFSSAYVSALLPKKDHEPSLSKEAAIYVGISNKQLYIQKNTKAAKGSSASSPYVSVNNLLNGEIPFPKVEWKPYLATAVSRTPVIHHSNNADPLLLNYEKKPDSSDLVIRDNMDYPFDNGYYLFGDSTYELNDSWATIVDGGEEIYFEDDSEESIIGEIQNNLWHLLLHHGYQNWERLFLILFLYAIAHMCVLRYLYMSLQRRIFRRASVMINIILHNIFRENRHVLLILQRIGLNMQHLPAPPPPPPPPPEAQLEVEPNSTSQDTQSSDSAFSSRYRTDFTPIACLGKGGFGIVVHVRNMLDENEYAIKRIVLPLKESSANRVKREVRALARLNHANIVRYYNSWLETPPPGWKDENALWPPTGDCSTFLSSPANEELDLKPKRTTLFQPPIQETSFLESQESKSLYPKIELLVGNSSLSSPHISFDDTHHSSDSNNNGLNDPSSDNSETSSDGEFSTDPPYQAPPQDDDDSLQIVFEDNDGGQNLNINTQKSFSDTHPSCEDESASNFTSNPSHSKRPVSVNKLEEGDCDNFNPKLKDRKQLKALPLNSSHTTSKDLCSSVPRTYLYIQMELCRKESLKEWLSNNSDRDKNEVLSIFNDIIHAVEYVHDRQLIHRDLKPSNIFFSLDGQVKIGDFGLVTTIDDDNLAAESPYELSQKQSLFKNLPHQRTHEVGTRLYMSPEQICGSTYDYKIDIYSLGLIFYEMLVPFGTEMERRTVLLKVREREFDKDFKDNYSNEMNLLQSMLHPHPAKRPTTRGVRVSEPLKPLQKDLSSIDQEEHFVLIRKRNRSNPSDSHSESTSSPSNSAIA